MRNVLLQKKLLNLVSPGKLTFFLQNLSSPHQTCYILRFYSYKKSNKINTIVGETKYGKNSNTSDYQGLEYSSQGDKLYNLNEVNPNEKAYWKQNILLICN